MKLKPLDQFPGLTELRGAMGADQLGTFDLFDPRVHITYQERDDLTQGVMSLPTEQLRVLKDRTLAFKNTRLWLSWEGENLFHLATCEQVQKQRLHKQTFVVGNITPPSSKKVCLHCLQLLKFDGLDARRGRRLDSDQLQEAFSLQAFKTQYPFYPIL